LYTPTFEELAGDERTFFAEYFNKKPLLRRKAITVDPREILSIADLDEVLHHEAIRLPYVRIAKDGNAVLDSSYKDTMRVQGEMVTDRVVPEHVYEHFQAGATITWNSMNHFLPNMRELTAMLGEKFSVRSDVIAFLTPAGLQGFAPHYDPVDLFIIQLEGTKYWRLWSPPEHRRGDVAHFKLEELGEPLFEVTMEPGDVLYLPYNTPHVAAAENEVSLHLSVMVRPRLWSEMLTRVVEDIVSNDPAFWKFPYLDEASFDEQVVALKQGTEALAARLADLDLEAQMRKLYRAGQNLEGATRRGTVFQDTAAVDRAGAETLFARSSADVSFGESTDGKTVIKIKKASSASLDEKNMIEAKSTTLKVPDPVAQSLRELGAAGAVAAGAFFPGVPEERSVAAAKTLARMGVLRLAA